MKVDRLVSIMMILLDQGRIGAQALADRFEVSPRTIYRDMDAINRAGIPVRSTPGAGGGFEIMQGYKIDQKVFSKADLSAILMGLSNLPSMMRGDELANALAKVKSIIPADQAKDIELKASQLSIDLSPWMGNRNLQPSLETIKHAIRECRLLSFEYIDRHGNKTARTAEPYQLVLKGSRWYWQGYCQMREDFRLFRLSRTTTLQMLEAGFTPREHPKPMLEISDAWAPALIEVKIRIHRSALERVLDYCPYEQVVPDGAEHYLVNFPFIENEFYYNMLISLGDQCECLEPLPIRAEMKRRIQNIAAQYDR